jgi:hypothetical protein
MTIRMIDEKLLPSPDLIDRVVAVANAYSVSRIKVLQSLPGNPVGIEARELGDNAIALMARHFPNPNFNRVAGLKRDQIGEIEPLVRWYRDNGVAARFEILPRERDGELGRELSRLGLYPSAFHTTLVRDVTAPTKESNVTVEQVTDAATLDAFLDAYIAGWKISDGPGFKRNVSAGWLNRPGWSLFFARVDGKPAAEGILYVKGGVVTWPTPRAILHFAGAVCTPACWRGASPKRAWPALISFAAVRPISRPAIATWSAQVCASCSTARPGPSCPKHEIKAAKQVFGRCGEPVGVNP